MLNLINMVEGFEDFKKRNVHRNAYRYASEKKVLGDYSMINVLANLYEKRDGIRVGDYVRHEGKLYRVGYIWEGLNLAQLTESQDGFFLGGVQTWDKGRSFRFPVWQKAYISYSGGFAPSITENDLVLTDERKFGFVWTFSGDDWKGDNAVYCGVEFRVYEGGRRVQG